MHTLFPRASNLVNNLGVVASDVTGVGTAREESAASTYGGDKGIFGYGYNGGLIGVTNLLTNAIKFSHPGAEIRIDIVRTNSSVDIVFSDQGVGISEDLLPEVFDIFTRARKEGTSGEKSTGLGLSITGRLVELHDASIDISSALNKGTDVRVSFPN